MNQSKPQLKLDWCSYEAANYAVAHWHYSKSMPVNKTARIGVWEDKRFIGCVIFSCGSAGVGGMSKTMKCESTAIAELARVALSNHQASVTRIIRIALTMVKRSQVGLRLIVSYADPREGHIGGIYQGGNWLYVGRSAPDTAYIDQNGRRWHSRSVSETGFKVHCGVKTKCPKPSTMQSIEVEPKYKYFYPLDPAMRAQILPLAKPYPKRAASIPANASGDQPEEGGAAPTAALQQPIITNGTSPNG